jgi:pimeloyl-ACP methyl ester carboxylesterase
VPKLSSLARPLYIETARGGVFGVLDAPAEPRPDRAAVLICSPWGWDDVASYRPRRALALQLAAAGHLTLRFDLPGTGNSAGSPRDDDLVGAWLEAVTAAANWLRAEAGAGGGLAVLGLGLGGLLALEAAARGTAIDELALWAAPPTGAAFVKEVRKFARLQAWQNGDEPAGAERLPPDWVEASGFLIAPETLTALEGLDPQPQPGSPRRALLLGRNGVEADQRLQERLRAAGVEVEAGSGRGRGWGAMVSHPERSRLPQAVISELEDWLSAGEGATAPAPGALPAPAFSTTLELKVDGQALAETPITVDSPGGGVFAIVTGPTSGAGTAPCAVFLNAGGVRNTGPNRMWVERARAWAARGITSARIDIEGIGEGGGNPDGIPPGNSFFDEKFADQVVAALAELRRRELGERFLLVGLCSGGYFAFRAALREPDVETVVLVNPWTLIWYPELEDEREARKASRALQPKWISKLVKGEVAWSKVRALLRSTAVGVGRKLRDFGRSRRERRRRRAALDAALDQLRDRQTRLVMAFADGEPLTDELAEIDFKGTLDRWPNLTLAELPGADHTLRPFGAQQALRGLLETELELALGAPEAAENRF